MTDRPYLNLSSSELGRLVQENRHNRGVLKRVHAELEHRKTAVAINLRRQVARLLEGLKGAKPGKDGARPPREPSAASSSKQSSLPLQQKSGAQKPRQAPPAQQESSEARGPSISSKSPPNDGGPQPGETAPPVAVSSPRSEAATPATDGPSARARPASLGETKEFTPEQRKARQVFSYLKELHEVRTPVQKDIADAAWGLTLPDLPVHENCALRSDLAALLLRDATLEDDSDSILSVRRPRLTTAPVPPAHLLEWVEGRWKDPRAEITHKPWLVAPAVGDASPRRVQFEAEGSRVSTWGAYAALRNDWRDREVPVRVVADVFDRLFEVHARLDREGERFDLVLGDGLLEWSVDSGALRYPILHQPVNLRFDPAIPKFTLQVSERPAVFHSAVFRGVEEAQASVAAEMRTRVEEGGLSPLQLTEAEDLYRSLVGKLHPHGWFGDEDPGHRDLTAPHVRRNPMLFLKDRAQGYGAFIERLLEVTDDEGVHPAKPLLPILGHHPDRSASGGQPLAPSEILLSKPANEEQIQVVVDLARSDGVVVQGPPGTGKSHTIANLIGHLLAHGKSVLVTSHTSKALRVLREKIVEPLQPLSVSVVTDDAASQAELDLSIRRIAERLGNDSAEDLDRGADRLRQEREALFRQAEVTRQSLLAARETEYRPIAVTGRTYSPSEAARIVSDRRGEDAWIPSGVERGAPMPLSLSEVRELYATGGTLSPEDERELAAGPPGPGDVLAPAEFTAYAEQAGRELQHQWLHLWQRAPAGEAFGSIQALAYQLQELDDALSSLSDWEKRALTAALRGGRELALWREFADDASTIADSIRGALVAVRRYGPQIPKDANRESLIEVAQELASRARGGRLGRLTLALHPAWRRFLETVQVDDRPPATPEEFRSIARAVELERLRSKLRRRWERMVEGLMAADVPEDQPETSIEQIVARLREILGWPRTLVEKASTALLAAGFRQENGSGGKVFAAEAAELDRTLHRVREIEIPAVLEYRDHCRRQQYQQKLDALHDVLTDSPTTTVGRRMRSAVLNLDRDAYAESHAEAARLATLQATHERRVLLLDRLRPAAEAWAGAIAGRQAPHGLAQPPGDPTKAWLWRQLEDEIVDREQADIQALHDSLSRTQDEIHRKTALLVENLAWAEQIRRTSGQARQDLLGYQQLLKKIGKGTGKRAPKLRIEAQKKLRSCRAAVPVWIMPLARVVQSFEPADTRFDFVIIDEASQMDIMGLLAFHLADKVLVVGDDEQVSPAAIGQKLDVVEQLIAQHLTGIPNASLYDGQTSIYDLAVASFSRSRMLKEHFRCVPEIIAYSNDLSYHGFIQPLRDSSASVLKPATISYRVRGGCEDGANINAREAEETAALVLAAVEQPEYETATFGVISLLGNSHDTKVDEHLRRRLRADQYAKHRILCGSPPQFQGDERDVVFLNMVKGPAGEGPLHLQSADHKVWKQRYNVAASRAKDQLWVVHSLDEDVDLQHADIRAGLLRHVRDPHSTERRISRVQERAESVFEKEVASDLVRAGFRVGSQFPVGNYRIDLVVECGDRRVAVECDGDRFHTAENLQADLERQAVLERLGGSFVRIRGTHFFRDRERTMAKVMEKLDRLGIHPEAGGGRDRAGPSQATELYERVTRRAAELLREWRGEEASEEETGETSN